MKRTLYTVVDGTGLLDVYGLTGGERVIKSKVAKLIISAKGEVFLDHTDIALSTADVVLLVELMQRVDRALSDKTDIPLLVHQSRHED